MAKKNYVLVMRKRHRDEFLWFILYTSQKSVTQIFQKDYS